MSAREHLDEMARLVDVLRIETGAVGPGTDRCAKACGEHHRFDQTCALGPATTPPAPTEPAREPVAGDRNSDHTITDTGGIRCWPSSGLAVSLDDGECSACGATVEPIPADPERAEGCACRRAERGALDHLATCFTLATPTDTTDVVDEPGAVPAGQHITKEDGCGWFCLACDWGRRWPGRTAAQAAEHETLVTPATPPAATVGEGDVEAWIEELAHDFFGSDYSPPPYPDNEHLPAFVAFRAGCRAVLAAGPRPRSTSVGEAQA